jgi:hypothetical protein
LAPSYRSSSIQVNFNVNANTSNLFSVPYINSGELDFYIYQNDINANTNVSRYEIPDFDSEIEKNGLAKSKYIAKKITFATDKSAEDIRVFLTGYRPAGTEIRVYAKIHNSSDRDTFDDKSWTPLEIKNNLVSFSGEDPNDYYEYTYGLPQVPSTLVNLTGAVFTVSNSDIITTGVNQTSSLTVGDIIKIYDPLVESNHEVFKVLNVTSPTVQINKTITNNNIVGRMYFDKLKYKNIAWNNIFNNNISRYYNSEGVEFDTFNSMQIKIVLLSDSTHVVPKVDQIQVIGVSA